MSTSDARKLDALVRGWSQRQAAPADRVAALEARIAAAVAAERTAAPGLASSEKSPSPDHTGRSTRLRRPIVWGAAATVAVAVAVCWILFLRESRDVAEKPVPDDGLPGIEHSAEELAAKRRLLAETDRLFEGRLTWLAEEGGRVQLGLAEESPDERDRSPAVAVRLVVARSEGPETDWVPIRSIEVIARSEEAVHMPEEGDALFLWAYVLPDGTVALDTDFLITERADLRATSSGLFAPGVPAVVASRRVNGEEYRVYQVVSLLGEATG